MTLAASLDGGVVARVHDGTLALYTVEPFEAVGSLALALPAPELAFVERHVLVRSGDKLALIATAPKLAIIDELEVPGLATVLATSSHYVLLERDGQLIVANCTSASIAVAPLRAHVAARHAVGLDRARFLIWSEPVADMWNAATRQPMARLAIELPPNTRAVGMTTQQRSLWIATASGELTVSRVSDGRTLAIELPGSPGAIASHAMSAWLVADVDGAPYAVNTALRSCARVELPAGERALVPAPAGAYAIVDAGDRLLRIAIGSDAATETVLDTAVPVAGSEPPAPPIVPDEPPPRPRRPWQRGEIERARTAAPDEVAVEEPEEPPPPPDPPSRLRVRAVAPAIARASSRRDTERVDRLSAPPFGGAARSGGAGPFDWRDTLWRWSRRALGGAPDEPLPDDDSPLAQLAERAGLSIAARRVLALLYADWLAGNGDRGVAAATLAEVAGPAGWAEGLATGRLAELGWVTSDGGRCVLGREVGAVLDGRISGDDRLFTR